MDDWKIRQEIYYRLNKIFDDDLNDKNIEFTKNVVEYAVLYFKNRDLGWIYPSKSYMVAICYSKWLSQHFGGDPLDYLSDSELLYNNDPYFLPYNSDKKTYDKILENIGGWNFSDDTGMIPDVKRYFLDEFMIGQKC